jgi:hypothetical protein
VVDRLRDLAGRPLDRRVARAALTLGLAVTVGFCLLVALAEVGRRADPGLGARVPAGPTTPAPSVPATRSVPDSPASGPTPRTRPRQDPQDRRGSAARRRAAAELESHRALQDVPWRQGDVAIELVGAMASRAILRVGGPDIAAARRGYRSFLRRFDDHGRAYLPRFRASGGRR